MNHGKSGCKKIGVKKKMNKNGEATESFLVGLTIIQLL